MIIALAPLSFAGAICDAVDSTEYAKAAGAKLLRGVGNVAFCWVELVRQPRINENKWEGAGRAVAHTIGRAVSGGLDAALAIVPGSKVPQMDPACPSGLFKS